MCLGVRLSEVECGRMALCMNAVQERVDEWAPVEQGSRAGPGAQRKRDEEAVRRVVFCTDAITLRPRSKTQRSGERRMGEGVKGESERLENRCVDDVSVGVGVG